VDYFDEEAVRGFECPGVPGPDLETVNDWRARVHDPESDLAPWVAAVREFQQLARDGVYRIVFFVNLAPEICPGEDRFYDAGMLAFDQAIIDVLGDGTPAFSAARAFLHYRPSQMPGASAHAFGNANRVKADVLFAGLRDGVLEPLLPASAGFAPPPHGR
jgi:hypothetical protein